MKIVFFFFQTAAKKRKEKEKIHIIIDKLNEELFKQKEHVERVRARLDTESGNWFKNRTFNYVLLDFILSFFFYLQVIEQKLKQSQNFFNYVFFLVVY
jgi:hypothetical protein